MNEQWKIIEGYPNYEVSDMGRVKSLNWNRTGKEKIMRPFEIKNGYLQVALRENGKLKLKYVHRLVASAFIPNPKNKREVNHINGIKVDNQVENLEWSTRSENVSHAYKNGLKEGHSKQKVRCIETGQEFESQLQAARYFGVDQGSIRSSILKRGRVLKQFHFELI